MNVVITSFFYIFFEYVCVAFRSTKPSLLVRLKERGIGESSNWFVSRILETLEVKGGLLQTTPLQAQHLWFASGSDLALCLAKLYQPMLMQQIPWLLGGRGRSSKQDRLTAKQLDQEFKNYDLVGDLKEEEGDNQEEQMNVGGKSPTRRMGMNMRSLGKNVSKVSKVSKLFGGR